MNKSFLHKCNTTRKVYIFYLFIWYGVQVVLYVRRILLCKNRDAMQLHFSSKQTCLVYLCPVRKFHAIINTPTFSGKQNHITRCLFLLWLHQNILHMLYHKNSFTSSNIFFRNIFCISYTIKLWFIYRCHNRIKDFVMCNTNLVIIYILLLMYRYLE